MCCKYFLHYCCLVLNFLNNVFWRTELLILMKFNIYFFLFVYCFSCPLYKIFATHCIKKFLQCFLPKIYNCSLYVYSHFSHALFFFLLFYFLFLISLFSFLSHMLMWKLGHSDISFHLISLSLMPVSKTKVVPAKPEKYVFFFFKAGGGMEKGRIIYSSFFFFFHFFCTRITSLHKKLHCKRNMLGEQRAQQGGRRWWKAGWWKKEM